MQLKGLLDLVLIVLDVLFLAMRFATVWSLIQIALLIIRLFIGVCFVVHGLGKLGIVGSGSMAGFEGWRKAESFQPTNLAGSGDSLKKS